MHSAYNPFQSFNKYYIFNVKDRIEKKTISWETEDYFSSIYFVIVRNRDGANMCLA